MVGIRVNAVNGLYFYPTGVAKEAFGNGGGGESVKYQ